MRIGALVNRIIHEMVRDKRTLGLLFIAPLLILSLMYFFFNGETADPKLGIKNMEANLITVLEDADIQIVELEGGADPKKTITELELDGILQIDEGQVQLTLENSNPTTAKALQMKVNQVFFVDEMLQQNPLQEIKTTYIYGDSETVFFDILSPILIGFFVFFFTFLISGIGLLKEKTSGTLERLLSTPIRRWEIVTAYVIGFGMFAAIQTIIVVIFAVHVLDVVLVGSIWSVLIINIILAFVALSLGTLLSSFAASEFQMMQFIPIVVIPQIFFSGIIPLDGMANWLQIIAKGMPIYYAADALNGVMYKGYHLMDVSQDLLILLAFAGVFIILNIFSLKKYRIL